MPVRSSKDQTLGTTAGEFVVVDVSAKDLEQWREARWSSRLLARHNLSIDPLLLDRDRAAAHVPVFESERLLGMQPGVGENAHERRISRPVLVAGEHLPSQRLEVDGSQQF
jgi:hypothetical protein